MVYITEGPASKQKFGNITEVINGMKDHPALLAYYIAGTMNVIGAVWAVT